MKRNVFLLSIALLMGYLSVAQQYSVKADQSLLKWEGKKIGGKHYGEINLKSGSFTLKNDQLVNGKFVIDMNSIVCHDLDSETWNKKLVDHLKSDDFFGVENFPVATLELKSSTAFNEDNKMLVKGLLTIKGKTNPIEFEAQRMGDVFSANIEVDRTLYDVRYGSKKFFANIGDKAINDIFTMEVKLVAQKK